MNFQLAPKLYIANTKQDLTLLFFVLAASGYKHEAIPADDPATTGVDEHKAAIQGADLLKIKEWGDFYAANIKELRAARAVPGTKEVVEVTFAGTALKAGSEGYLVVEFESVDKPSALMNHDARKYARTERFQILIDSTTNTPTKVAELVQSQYNKLLYSLRMEGFTMAQAGAKLTLTGADESYKLHVRLEMTSTDSNLTATANTVAKQYSGRGTYHELRTWRIPNDTNTRPYAGKGPYDGNATEQVIEGALYTSLLVTQRVEKPELSGHSMVNEGPVGGDFQFHLYINEALKNEINDLVAFFEANAPQKAFYPAVTSNAAQAVETPEANSTNFLATL
jgi:hypothetical protein